MYPIYEKRVCNFEAPTCDMLVSYTDKYNYI
jgi:hypothetical protein